jgi:hypothetical protein
MMHRASSACTTRAAAAPIRSISKKVLMFSMGSVAHGSLSQSGQTLAGVGQKSLEFSRA